MTQNNTLPFINPATGEQYGEIPIATPDQVHQALAEMRRNAPAWHNTPTKERVRIIRKMQKLLIDYSEEITIAISQDTGKTRQDALIELFLVLDRLQVYLKNAGKWLTRQRVSPGLYPFRRYYTEPTPYGVVGVISPWNYPFELSMPPVFSALLAGNAVLLKPSEVTPAVGVLIEKLFQSVPELAPYIRILHGGSETGATLVSAEPDLIFLTGSTGTGRKVAKSTADRMVPYICELGGKDPMIVLEDADIKSAARWGSWGGFYHAGQTCVSIERVYVVEPVYDAFLSALIKETKQIKVGYTTDVNSPYHYGPMTFPRQLEIVQDHLQDAVKKGAKIIMGGGIDKQFVEPTILVDVNHSMKIMQEETFGPIMPIMKVRDGDEAVQLANDSEFGLGATVWSQDIARAERLAKRLEVGTVNINDAISHYAIPELPFGGLKQSGSARTHGAVDLLQFTQLRSYAVGRVPRWFDIATHLRQPGRYWLGDLIMKTMFGVTPRQKLEPIIELASDIELKPETRRTIASVTLAGAAFGLLFGFFRSRRS